MQETREKELSALWMRALTVLVEYWFPQKRLGANLDGYFVAWQAGC